MAVEHVVDVHTAAAMAPTMWTGSDHPGVDRRMSFARRPLAMLGGRLASLGAGVAAAVLATVGQASQRCAPLPQRKADLDQWIADPIDGRAEMAAIVGPVPTFAGRLEVPGSPWLPATFPAVPACSAEHSARFVTESPLPISFSDPFIEACKGKR